MSAVALSDFDLQPHEPIARSKNSVLWLPRYVGAPSRITLSETPEMFRPPADTAAMPGVAVTSELLDRSTLRTSLLGLIDRMASDPFPVTPGLSLRITMPTAAAAKALLRLVPERVPLPRIAPEEDGGLLMIWEAGERRFLLVIEGWRLHLVVDPATDQAEYFQSLSFDGELMPQELAKAIAVS